MDHALSAILKRASSELPDEQTEALSQIAMLLEKNTRPSDELGFYASVLPAAVMGLELNVNAQKQLLRELLRNPNLERAPSSFLWAVGKASPQVAIDALSTVLQRHSDWLRNSETAYQAIIALENCLDYDRERAIGSVVEQTLLGDAVTMFLQREADSPETRNRDHASRILRRMAKLRKERGNRGS